MRTARIYARPAGDVRHNYLEFDYKDKFNGIDGPLPDSFYYDASIGRIRGQYRKLRVRFGLTPVQAREVVWNIIFGIRFTEDNRFGTAESGTWSN